jgi:hypothetical protein
MANRPQFVSNDVLSLQQGLSRAGAATPAQPGSGSSGDVLLPASFVGADVNGSVGVGPYSPRALTALGGSLWVGESSQDKNGATGILRRFEAADGFLSMSRQIDLRTQLDRVNQIRDLAEDADFVYAACWDTGNVAIVRKSTGTLAGWAFCDNRAVSVAADGAGNLYVLVAIRDEVDQTRLQRFTVASCLGQLPGVARPDLDVLLAHNQRHVRFGGGFLWLADGGFDLTGVTKADPATLAVVATCPIVGERGVMDVLYAFGSVWACGQGIVGCSLWRIDPVTLAFTTIRLPEQVNQAVALAVGPNAAAEPASAVWVTDMGSGSVVACDAATNLVDQEADIGRNYVSEGVAAIGDTVMVGSFLPSISSPYYSGLFTIRGGNVTQLFSSQTVVRNPT